MKIKTLHIVPEIRFGGIFIYIQMFAKGNNNSAQFIFSGQPSLNGIYYLGKKPYNFRSYSPFFIIIDLILNTFQYSYSSLISKKVFLHTPFLIFHHLFFLLLRQESYLILHDFNIPFPLRIIFKILKPDNVFCVSEVLYKKFKFLSYTKVLTPYYSSEELYDFLENMNLDFPKNNIIFSRKY